MITDVRSGTIDDITVPHSDYFALLLQRYHTSPADLTAMNQCRFRYIHFLTTGTAAVPGIPPYQVPLSLFINAAAVTTAISFRIIRILCL